MKLADCKYQKDEYILDYLERATNLITKFLTKEFDISMAIVRGINNREQQGQIKQKCYRTEDFAFTSISKLVKVCSIKIGYPDPFDFLVQHTSKLSATVNSVQVEYELLQQLFVNNASTLSAILQRMKPITNANI